MPLFNMFGQPQQQAQTPQPNAQGQYQAPNPFGFGTHQGQRYDAGNVALANMTGGAAGAGHWVNTPQTVVDQQLAEKNRMDQAAAAERRQATDRATASNSPDSYGPFGSQQTLFDPVTGKRTINTQLGGPYEALLQALQGQAIQGAQSHPFDISGLPSLVSGDAARDQAINGAYGQATSRLDPMFNQREDALRTRLLNQGLDPSSEAYKNAMGDFGRERNDAYSSAMNGAIGQGTAAGQAIFGQSLQGHQQALADALAGHQVPQADLAAALGGFGSLQGLTQTPSFMGAGTAAPADPYATYMAQQAQNQATTQARQQRQADTLAGGLGFIGGLAGLVNGGVQSSLNRGQSQDQFNQYMIELQRGRSMGG